MNILKARNLCAGIASLLGGLNAIINDCDEGYHRESLKDQYMNLVDMTDDLTAELAADAVAERIEDISTVIYEKPDRIEPEDGESP